MFVALFCLLRVTETERVLKVLKKKVSTRAFNHLLMSWWDKREPMQTSSKSDAEVGCWNQVILKLPISNKLC